MASNVVPDALSQDLKTRIAKVKQLAEGAEVGSALFVQVSPYPLTSLVVITREVLNKESNKHSVH